MKSQKCFHTLNNDFTKSIVFYPITVIVVWSWVGVAKFFFDFYSSNLSDRYLFKSRKPILCNQMVWDAFMLEFTQAKCSKIFGYYLILNKILRNKNVSFIIDILLVIRVCLRPCNLCFIIMVLFVFRHLCCVKQFFFQIT